MSGSASSSPSYLSAIGDTFALLLNTPLVESKAEAGSKGRKPEPVQLQEITRGSSRKAMGGTSLPDVSSRARANWFKLRYDIKFGDRIPPNFNDLEHLWHTLRFSLYTSIQYPKRRESWPSTCERLNCVTLTTVACRTA
ncbi:hypothetical protein AB1N83_011712 [Pleurotus pulmonarius]